MSGPKPKVIFRGDSLAVVRVKPKTGSRARMVLEEKGKVTPVRARDGKILDDILNLLPAAAWRSKFALLIKASTRRVVDNVAKFAKGPHKARLAALTDFERVALLRSATRARLGAKGRGGAVSRADGLLREMDFWHEFDSSSRTPRAAAVHAELQRSIADFNKAAPASQAFEEEVRYARRAYTPGSSPKGLPPGEVGDLIAYTLSKNKKPTRIWIMMIGNAKGATNAVALASKGGWYKPRSEELLLDEFLGQPDFDLERIPEFGIELPGVGQFMPDEIKVGPQSTLRIGVVPPDISTAVRNQLENFAKFKSKAQFRLWDSRIPGAESRKAAENLVDIIEGS
jgi:hypothetical protein